MPQPKEKHKRVVTKRKHLTDKRKGFRAKKDEPGEEVIIVRFRSRRKHVNFEDLSDEGEAFSNGILRTILMTMSPESILIQREESDLNED